MAEEYDYRLRIDMFSKINKISGIVNYEEFRKQYNIIAVVTIINNCKLCESKIEDWINNATLFIDYDEFAVLFVLQKFDIKKFKIKLKNLMI